MMWKQTGQEFIYGLLNPVLKVFIKIGVTPNMITSAGLFLNLIAAVILVIGAELGERGEHRYVAWSGIVILLAGLMDMIDGRLARLGNMAKPFGALYDSVLDRYSEMIMFLGICYYLVAFDYFLSSIFAFIAMIGSIMVSYTRARAEGLGINCSVGLMQRPERILIVGISAILCGITSALIGRDFKIAVDYLPFPVFETITVFTFPIFILAIWANLTALKRLSFAKQQMERKQNNS